MTVVCATYLKLKKVVQAVLEQKKKKKKLLQQMGPVSQFRSAGGLHLEVGFSSGKGKQLANPSKPDAFCFVACCRVPYSVVQEQPETEGLWETRRLELGFTLSWFSFRDLSDFCSSQAVRVFRLQLQV